jgi:hypothetical protein
MLLKGSEYERDEALGVLHVVSVGWADCGRERAFLHPHAIEVAGQKACQDGDQAEPVAYPQSDADGSDQRPRVGGMADQTVGPALDDLLIGADCDITGEVAPKRADGISAEAQSEQYQKCAQGHE